jgi:hypothetical protein
VIDLAPGFLYSVFKDVVAKVWPKRRKLTPAEIVELRKKWKAEIEPHVVETWQKKLRTDVVIRDMRRIDSYPDAIDKKGISPWFRVGLVGTYHRGIQVGLRWTDLTKHTDGKNYRRTNYKAGEKGEVKALLIGLIPFENIENIDWDGDEYYGYPHIYCYFSHRREPYEALGYYAEIIPSHGFPHYTEVATYQSVRKFSKKLGLTD